jgi:hypothetical protein
MWRGSNQCCAVGRPLAGPVAHIAARHLQRLLGGQGKCSLSHQAQFSLVVTLESHGLLLLVPNLERVSVLTRLSLAFSKSRLISVPKAPHQSDPC